MSTLAVRINDVRGDLTLDIAFTAPLPGVVTLFGPSGVGKSSIASAVAGLWRPRDAEIALGDTVFQEGAHFVAPERRELGMVFQDSRLFPHLNVRANLLYGARRSAKRGGTAAIDFTEIVAILGLEGKLGSHPATLSGGERQRVAIGRALLSAPRMLLMDEPLASLDAERRDGIIACLQRLRAVSNVPMLHVTHALDEVAALTDTLVVLAQGRVIAHGPVDEIMGSAALPVARRRDAFALLRGRVAGHDTARGLSAIDCDGTILLIAPTAAPVGTRLGLRIPAREVILAQQAPTGISLHNMLPATVRDCADAGGGAEIMVGLALAGGASLLARVTRDAVGRLGLAPGVPILALIKSTSVEVVRMEPA